MELNRKHALIAVALIGVLLLSSSTTAASWVANDFFELGEANCPVSLTVTLLDKDGVPVNVPIITNNPFFVGTEEVTTLRVTVVIDVTASADMNWETVSIKTVIATGSYVENVRGYFQYEGEWTLTHLDFTGADGEYSNTHTEDFLLTDLELQQNSVAEDDTITWKFDIRATVTGQIFKFDGTPVHGDPAQPVQPIAGPIILTTPPPPIPLDTFYFDADLNPWVW